MFKENSMLQIYIVFNICNIFIKIHFPYPIKNITKILQ